MSTAPYIGCKLSVLSFSDIRYEGVLVSVDPVEKTITLSQLRSFGTEDRRRGSGEVAATDDVYAEVSFKSQVIKDISVLDKAPGISSDPAIVSAKMTTSGSQLGTPSKQQTAQPFTTPKREASSIPKPAPTLFSDAPAARNVMSYSTGTGRKQIVERSIEATATAAHMKASYASAVGYGHGNTPSRYTHQSSYQNRYHPKHSAPRTAPFEMPTGDFDFVAANTRFDKEELRSAQAEAPTARYNKLKSFFDDISCDTKDGHSQRQHHHEDRRVNLDTFGQTSLNTSYNPRRGRGGGRGGYRGGYGNRPGAQQRSYQ